MDGIHPTSVVKLVLLSCVRTTNAFRQPNEFCRTIETEGDELTGAHAVCLSLLFYGQQLQCVAVCIVVWGRRQSAVRVHAARYDCGCGHQYLVERFQFIMWLWYCVCVCCVQMLPLISGVAQHIDRMLLVMVFGGKWWTVFNAHVFLLFTRTHTHTIKTDRMDNAVVSVANRCLYHRILYNWYE